MRNKQESTSSVYVSDLADNVLPYNLLFCHSIMFSHHCLISRSEYQKLSLKELDNFISLFGIFPAVHVEIPWTGWVVG